MPSIHQDHGCMGDTHTRKIRLRCVTRICLCLACTYLLLLIPEGTSPQTVGAGKQPFIWNRAQLWASLEQNFVQARGADKTIVSSQVAHLLGESRRLLVGMTNSNALDPRWSEIETNLFELAPLVGADPARLPEFVALVNGIRREAKEQSSRWDLNSDPVRQRLYRLLAA